MKIYKPSNIVPTPAYLWFLLSALVTGGIIGGITSFIGAFFYLIILFPIGMGFAGTGATQLIVKLAKVRNPAIALFFGALTGVSMYSAMHLFDYSKFQQEIAKELRTNYATELQQEIENSGRTETQILQGATDSILLEETGQKGFLGYMKFAAQQGMEISRSGRGGIPIGGTFMWIYWSIELGIILYLSGFVGSRSAKEPFSEAKNEWYGTPQRVGNVAEEQCTQFVELLKDSHHAEAGQLINSSHDEEIPVPSIEVYVHRFGENTPDASMLALSNTSFDRKKNIKTNRFLMGSLSPEEWSQFHDAIPE